LRRVSTKACKYFELLQRTPFKGKCAVITSYNPLTKDVTLEETDANTETVKQFIFNTYTELLGDVTPEPGETRTETYEQRAKELIKAHAKLAAPERPTG
jgi:type I restriction enzyme R subunit